MKPILPDYIPTLFDKWACGIAIGVAIGLLLCALCWIVLLLGLLAESASM